MKTRSTTTKTKRPAAKPSTRTATVTKGAARDRTCDDGGMVAGRCFSGSARRLPHGWATEHAPCGTGPRRIRAERPIPYALTPQALEAHGAQGAA